MNPLAAERALIEFVALTRARPTRAACAALRLLVDVVIFVLVLHRALPDLAADETLLLCGRVVGTEVGIPFGAIKPEF